MFEFGKNSPFARQRASSQDLEVHRSGMHRFSPSGVAPSNSSHGRKVLVFTCTNFHDDVQYTQYRFIRDK